MPEIETPYFPWKFDGDDGFITDNMGRRVAAVCLGWDAYGDAMAAAPELLSALKDLYEATPDNEGGVLGEACKKARAAIAKAEGRR